MVGAHHPSQIGFLGYKSLEHSNDMKLLYLHFQTLMFQFCLSGFKQHMRLCEIYKLEMYW